MAVAQRRNDVLVERDVETPVVDDDKIVAGTVHFVEVKKHGKIVRGRMGISVKLRRFKPVYCLHIQRRIGFSSFIVH
jgi:hypothetical protein